MTESLSGIREGDLGPWLMTFTGRHFHFLSPNVDEIDIMDIAVATSREGRFAGHCWSFYSVAQHCVHVSEKIEDIVRSTGRGPCAFFDDDGNYVEDRVVEYDSEEGNRLVARMSLVGLLHDASEAYLKDMPSPIKAELPRYKDMEASLMDVIMEKHDLLTLWKCGDMQYLIHKVDKAVMACEVRDLIKHKKVWSMPELPYEDLTIVPAIPDTAAVQFLARYSTLLRDIEG